jgi:hypothetical protein
MQNAVSKNFAKQLADDADIPPFNPFDLEQRILTLMRRGDLLMDEAESRCSKSTG